MRIVLAMAVAVFLCGAASAPAQAQVPCDSFAKNTDGSWIALNNVEVPGLGRRMSIRQGSVLKPGAAILGVDLAAYLDEQCPAVLPQAPAAANAEPPPDLQKKYADANGNIDVQKLTCGQLVSTYQEDADFVLLWSSGFRSGLAKKSALNVARLRQDMRGVIAYCQANKDKRVAQAIDAVARDEPR